MPRRGTVVLVAILMLLVPSTAIAGDGHNTVETDEATITNDEQHETRLELAVAGGPEDVGLWNEPEDAEIAAVNLAVLPGGKLLYYSGIEADEDKDDATHLHFMWNATPKQAESRVATLTDDGLAVSTPSPADGGGFDLFCSGTTITPEGLAVAPGATQWYTLDQDVPDNFNTPLKGANQTKIFHPNAGGDDWIDGPEMDEPRWYPSALQLPDGDTLVASGVQTLFWPNTYVTELATYDPDDAGAGWEYLETSFRIAEDAQVPQNVLPSGPDTGVAPVDETHQGVPNLPMYPRLHVIPDGPHKGEVLYPANGDSWAPFGWHPNQELWSHIQTLDTEDGSWEIHPRSEVGHRNLGTVVPMMVDAEDPQPRYLSLGGTLQQSGVASATSEIIDASGETITSELTDTMTFPRWSVNGVLLPDGSVFAVGGSVYDNVLMHGSPTIGPLNAERFVPNEDGTDGQWELLPGMEDVRAYHSSAVLLPDGSIAVAGHVPLPAFHDAQRNELGNPQPVNTTIEIYEPDYLHHEDQTRPEILSTGFGMDLGEADALHVPDEMEEVTLAVEGLEHGLDSLVLVRPGAATHQYNADQLGVELDVVGTNLGGDGAGTVTFQAPHDLAIPPGHYMLFANEDTPEGIYPSEAAWIALGDEVELDGQTIWQ